MSASEKSGAKLLGLISPARAECFLLDLANYDPLGDPLNELLMAVVREHDQNNQRITTAAERVKRLYPEMAEPFKGRFDKWEDVLYWTRIYLVRAWTASDERRRNWYLFEMRRKYRDAAVEVREWRSTGVSPSYAPHQRETISRYARAQIDPPELTPFEVAASYFQSRVGSRAKYCANSGCNTPYFIAPPAKARKYCSLKCSSDADAINKHESYMRKKTKKGML